MSLLACDEDIQQHSPNACGVALAAAVSAFALVKRGQTDITDFTNPTQWETAIANGNAGVAKDLTIDFPDGSPLNVDSKKACGPPQRQVAVDYTATLIDENVNDINENFYATMSGGTYDIVLFYCRENKIRVLDNGQFSARIPQAVGNDTDTQHYNGTFTWRRANNDFGLFLDAPAGIFE